MDCATVTELLGNYIDEDLTAALRQSLEQHLAGCQSCATDLATLQSTIDALGKVSADIEGPSPWFTERLLHRVAEESGIPLRTQTPGKDLQLGLW